MNGLHVDFMRLNSKIIMLALVVCMSVPVAAWSLFEQVPANDQKSSNTAMIAGAAGMTAVAVGAAAVYALYRESNSSLADRAHAIIVLYERETDEVFAGIQSVEDLQLFAVHAGAVKREMIVARNEFHDMCNDLEGRYGSLFTPWNWTHKMKDAIKKASNCSEQIDFLLTVLKYTPCLRTNMTSDELVGAARIMRDGESMYPVLEIVESLRADIYNLKNSDIYIPCGLVCIEALEMIRSTLIVSDRYTGEFEAREQEKQVKQREKAAEERARIQREHSLALARQVSAIEERNKLERKKINNKD